MMKNIEILNDIVKDRKSAFKTVEGIKNTATYRAGRAHKDAAKKYDEIHKELYSKI